MITLVLEKINRVPKVKSMTLMSNPHPTSGSISRDYPITFIAILLLFVMWGDHDNGKLNESYM